MIRFVDAALDPFLWALAGWSIRWGVLIAALAAWFLARPPQRAATRHLLCATALAAGLVLPFAPRWSAPWPRSSPAPAPVLPAVAAPIPQPAAPDQPPSLLPMPDEPPRPIGSAQVGRPASRPMPWFQLGLGAAWLAGAVGALARLAIGRAILARLRATARPVSGAVFEGCRREVEMRRGVGLAAHPAVGSPIALGGRSPLILVPDDWETLAEAEQRACLLHELAHLARRDDLAKLLAELVRAPFWFHPAVLWLVARLDREAELACDEAAVGRGVPPHDLAQLLLAFARRPHRLDPRGLALGRQALSFFDRGTVSTRITRLLEDDMTRTTIPPSRARLLGLAAPLAALALAIGGARVRAIEPDAPPQQPAPAEAATPPPAPAPPPARSFSVVVKDGEGRPIEGATVVATDYLKGAARDVARTDAEGLARFVRAPGQGLVLKATREGYGFASHHDMEMEKKTGPIILILSRPRSLSGSVVDDQGRPIAGAEVGVESASDPTPIHWDNPKSGIGLIGFSVQFGPATDGTPIELLLATRADRDGRFVLEGVPAGKRVTLRASAEGYAPADVAAPEADKPARVVLAPEARVAGRVVSEVPGVAVSGRSVQIWTTIGGANAPTVSSLDLATTDAEGRFEARGLKAGRAALFLKDVPADGPWTFRAASDVPLVPGSVAEATIAIVAGVAVEGRVTSADGSPMPGVRVFGSRSRGSRASVLPVLVTTDAAGAYRLRLAAGDAFDYFAAPVTGRATPGPIKALGIVTIPDGVAHFSLPTIRLAPPAAPLRGRLLDAAGVPLEGARLVGISGPADRQSRPLPPVIADEQGRFVIEDRSIPSNQSAKFHIRLADGREFDASAVPTGEGELTIKLPTLRDGGPKGPEQVAPDELAGVVVDVQGKPLEGVLAHAYSWVPRHKTLTDKDGRFRLKVPDQGKVEIRLTRDGYEPREFLGRQTGEPGWVVVMGNRTYFEGRVLAPDGSPVADAPIRADSGPKMLEGARMGECWTEGRSGQDGRYRLYVEPGMYDFEVRMPGVGVARVPKQAIATDEVRALDIQLAPGVDFVARVVDHESGKPVAGVRLWHWQKPGVEGTSDGDGRIAIRGLPPGKYPRFQVEAEGYARWWSAACLNEGARFQKANPNRFGFQCNFDALNFEVTPGMAPVTIEVERAATIRGRVLDPDGKPVAGATVAPALTGSGNSLTGDTRFSFETGPDGTYTMTLPASGAIAYNLVAHDGKFQQWRTWANGINPPFRTAPGQVMGGVDLRLTRPATVSGRVVDAEGRPVAGREVRSSAADKRENRYYDPTTKTGADGTFELKFVRAGEQHIQVAPFWLDAEQAPAGTSRTLTLAEGEVKEGVALTAAPGR